MDTLFEKIPNYIFSVIYLNTEIVVSYLDKVNLSHVNSALTVCYSKDISENKALYSVKNSQATIKLLDFEGDRLNLLEIKSLQNQIQFIFQIASKHGQDTILIKWTGQNAQHVAEVFHSELEKYKGVCKKIIFALGKSEYEIYKNTFSAEQ